MDSMFSELINEPGVNGKGSVSNSNKEASSNIDNLVGESTSPFKCDLSVSHDPEIYCYGDDKSLFGEPLQLCTGKNVFGERGKVITVTQGDNFGKHGQSGSSKVTGRHGQPVAVNSIFGGPGQLFSFNNLSGQQVRDRISPHGRLHTMSGNNNITNLQMSRCNRLFGQRQRPNSDNVLFSSDALRNDGHRKFMTNGNGTKNKENQSPGNADAMKTDGFSLSEFRGTTKRSALYNRRMQKNSNNSRWACATEKLEANVVGSVLREVTNARPTSNAGVRHAFFQEGATVQDKQGKFFGGRQNGAFIQSSVQAIDPSIFQSETALRRVFPVGRVEKVVTINGARICWTGDVRKREHRLPVFARKVFVGGIPLDILEKDLIQEFGAFGQCRLEWPFRTLRFDPCDGSPLKNPGYVYVVYEDEVSVRRLLKRCVERNGSTGELFFAVPETSSSARRQVQVIPWVTSDSFYSSSRSAYTFDFDPSRTVFVGGLHGMVTAELLYTVMEEVFGEVLYAALDKDKNDYPIGSGRVVFSLHESYMRAVDAGYLVISTTKFTKRSQIEPYIAESQCSMCNIDRGVYFCKSKLCFTYYCFLCWQKRHGFVGTEGDHKAIFRQSRRVANPNEEIGTTGFAVYESVEDCCRFKHLTIHSQSDCNGNGKIFCSSVVSATGCDDSYGTHEQESDQREQDEWKTNISNHSAWGSTFLPITSEDVLCASTPIDRSLQFKFPPIQGIYGSINSVGDDNASGSFTNADAYL